MSTNSPPAGERKPVAYLNQKFMNSPDARVLRILAEFLEPLAHFRREKVRDTVVFFGSARIREDGPLGRYYAEARELARLLTAWADQFTNGTYRFVVCSGGGPGIMEAANRGAQDAGGKTIGLNIGLPFEQFPNPYITPSLSFEFRYFFMRKFWFAYLAKALVVFPGGFGTLDEMMELLTLMQTQKLRRRRRRPPSPSRRTRRNRRPVRRRCAWSISATPSSTAWSLTRACRDRWCAIS
jgi:uncharacterized protein (TIGR00730 family)